MNGKKSNIFDCQQMQRHRIALGPPYRNHTEAISTVVTEIQEHAGNPERIRQSLAAAGQRRFKAGMDTRFEVSVLLIRSKVSRAGHLRYF